MTYSELIYYLIFNEGSDINDLEVLSIGTVSGSDKDCEYIIHLEDGTDVKIG